MIGYRVDSTYETWMRQEGVPIARGHDVPDVWGLELGEWKRWPVGGPTSSCRD